MHAGPEIGVASTKAFTAMIVATYLLGLWLGRQRDALTAEDVRKRIHDLVEIPRLVEQTLELDSRDRRRSPGTCRAPRISSISAAGSSTRSRSRAR